MPHSFSARFTQFLLTEQRSFAARFAKRLLFLLSVAYKTVIYLRSKSFEKGVFRSFQADIPLVISIGNITAGGTGKTPLTLLLGNHFCSFARTAIISRGYRSQAEHNRTSLVLSQGNGPLFPPEIAGDEPFLIAKNLPNAIVIVGKKRIQSAILASNMQAQALILDDGFQHRYLKRDYDIVVVDGNDPLGLQHFLPRGFLRDSPSRLSEAELIIINNISNEDHFHNVQKILSSYSQAPCIGTKIRVCGFFDRKGEPTDSIMNSKIAIFCGIARPQSFLNTLKEFNVTILNECYLADHKTISFKEWQSFVDISLKSDVKAIVCTEKDIIKLSSSLVSSLPVIYPKIELEIAFGKPHWNDFLQKARKKMDNIS